ncbi:AAA family ATPase [Caballeronia sp. SEWSISQ10-4 2]|uniref:AAA family ATPase n=1 Tax=Caballeronia sp. SEWSISQ10-4 2 TaxID=2937438 RepID=UPI00264C5361|nr:AAA family ATPase [Caballeronia sp. SEWSISQ10-4 2]MDN7177290.1 AAA family ATPase [Caballeronia sp. SEWSISQ10-4 2]
MDTTHGFDAGSSLQILWEDGERVFCRERPRDGSDSVLVARIAAEHPLPASVARLAHEFALRDQLNGTWAVRPKELLWVDGRTVLVLEDPGGEPLERLIGAPMETGNVLRLAVGIAAALGKLHQAGLVHKDLKPAHILVNCADAQVRLTGFGIASRLPRERQPPEPPEPPETIAGTLAYMAPEQTGRMNRSIDSRSDLYAFGVALYQMLTGTLPFTAATPMEWVHCHVARKPMPPSARVGTVPPGVSALVMKLLAKTPEERYQTAAGVERDLRHCLAEWEQLHRIDTFRLGAHDMPDRLLIPEKLYGREREVGALVAAFNRVISSGAPELVLISGYSGIGKSAVVNELHKLLVPPRGLFASGKFDQYKRDIPYSTLVQAFRGLVRPLLGKREMELATWRDALTEALGPNARLMTDLIPELKLIIGDPPPVPEFEPHQAQRRFQLVFRRFIGVFARPEHPLALFLDDLQWLDAATLDLLEDLLTRPDLRHLMLIGAYRSNEVDAAHPLMRKLQAIRNAGSRFDEVALAPLAREHVEQLIAEALRDAPERAAPLAQLVHEKTAGNPFFVIQFLHALVDEGLLGFDHDTARWFWDLPNIHGKGYTDNVADLMVAKLARLAAETQQALQQFACLGNTATMAMLSNILESSRQEIQALLRPAVEQELIEQLEESCRFVHDRVQEAAYSMIPEASRAEAHLRIGRLLAAQTLPEKRKEAIFEIVNQLNRGAALLTLREEREQLAEFNLIAGQRAKASSAYESALTYLTTGAELLTDDCWARQHELIFTLELNRAECEFLTGRLPVAEERLNMLSRRAANVPERANVTGLRVDLYMTLDQASNAVAVALDYLGHLGIDWSPHTAEEKARKEYERIWSQLGNRAIEELIDLRLMTDVESLATMDVLVKVMPAALFTDTNLWSLVVSRAVNLSLEYGNCDGSSSAYVRLGMIAAARFGHYKIGFQFGQLGYDLVERRGLKRFRARTYMHFGNIILPMARPLRDGRELIRRGLEAAKNTGDLICEAYCYTHMTTNLLIAGDPLTNVQREAEASLMFAQKAHFGFAIDVSATQLGLVRTLRGLTLAFGSFNDGHFDEKQIERHFLENPDLVIAHCWYWIRKLQARFFAGDYAAATDASLRAQRLLWTAASYLEEAEYHFYSALSLAARCNPDCSPVSGSEQRGSLQAIAAHNRQLQLRAETCPENFENLTALVSAEIARLERRDLDAMRLYEEAIRSARANGFVHNEALAGELTSRFYAARGFEKIARVYLSDARQGYRRWGADGKVRQLDEMHPYLREGEQAPGPTSTIGAPVEHLDLATVIRVSQAVSGEMVLDKLIDTVMRTAIEQAGAERGLLILPDGEEPRIAAEVTTDGDTPRVQLRDVPVSAAMLPESVLYHVLRTQESVILDDAASEPTFATDPYIRQHRTRSMLCLPLMNRAKLIGALYLENNLITRVFAPARIAGLRLLASQAATSLENTRLYRDLAERESRIRRLVDANIIGIIVWRSDGDILEANDAFLRMVGYEREDLLSGRVRWTDLTPPEWRETTEFALAQLSKFGRVQPEEKEYLRKDGSRVAVMIGRVAFEAGGKEGVAFVVDLTERKEAEHRLRESYEMLRELTSRRETAREEERKHIAREMHDELGQYLTALRMRTSALRMRFNDDQPELFEETRTLIALVDQTMQVVRGVITSLRPPVLDAGIVAALEWLAAGFDRNGHTVCRLRVQDENIVMSEDRAIVLFRLVQEALTNVARHAAATEVIIMLERTPDAFVLEVRDDGQGFDAQAIRKTSFGLAGMEERVLMLGGQIEVVSAPGAGTAIKVRLPDRQASST